MIGTIIKKVFGDKATRDLKEVQPLVEKIKEAFFTFDFIGTALGDEFEGVSKFVPINYQDDWTVIRQIQKANGVEYTPAGLDD